MVTEIRKQLYGVKRKMPTDEEEDKVELMVKKS